MSYLKPPASRRQTPQTQPIPGRSEQVRNSAGGYVFKIDPLEQMRRFLILGAAGGTYYASQRSVVKDNVAAIKQALDEFGTEAVDVIVQVSRDGNAPRNDEALFALAYAASKGNAPVRDRALRSLPEVARIGTHLFMFLEFVTEWRGWGPALKRAVAAWYEQKDGDKLAYQMVKYQSRGKWSHRGVLQHAHPRPQHPVQDVLFAWASQGVMPWAHPAFPTALGSKMPDALEGYFMAQGCQTPAETAAVIRQFKGRIPREALRSEHQPDAEVWKAQIDVRMPMGAMVRNLANMTRAGVLAPMSPYTDTVCERLRDQAAIRKSRLHPLEFLKAIMAYKDGVGERGQRWAPVQSVIDALTDAFYLSFGNVEPAGKNTMLAVDISGSMTSHLIAKTKITARMGAAAMALAIMNTEPRSYVYGFSTRKVALGYNGLGNPEMYDPRRPQDWLLQPLNISTRMRLTDVAENMRKLPAGGTDCALPMEFAAEKHMPVDTFVILTDNETWAGRMHPSQALREYRKRSGRKARLVVVGMTATGFSIADPSDAGMLDVVGLDTSTPAVINAFSRGEF